MTFFQKKLLFTASVCLLLFAACKKEDTAPHIHLDEPTEGSIMRGEVHLFSSLGHPKLKPKQIGEIFLLVPGVNRSGYGFVRPVDLDLNGENGFSDFNGFFRAQR